MIIKEFLFWKSLEDWKKMLTFEWLKKTIVYFSHFFVDFWYENNIWLSNDISILEKTLTFLLENLPGVF